MNNFRLASAWGWLRLGVLGLVVGMGPLAAHSQTILVGPTRPYPTLRAAVAAGAVVSGATVLLDDGTYTDKAQLDGVSNVTIRSACGRAGGVVFDGGSQDNLFNRKAIILVQNCPGLAIVGLRFKNAGDPAAQGSGAGNQAGISYENSTGTARVSYCSFDNCVTGIFGREGAVGLDLAIDHCDFGYAAPNGTAPDGLSHDIYLGHLRSFTGVANNWYGSLNGNNCKTRALSNTISGGYNANNNGRCVDMPDGGTYSITDGVYLVGNGPNHVLFSYAPESQSNGAKSGTVSGITLRTSAPTSYVLNNAAGTTMGFINTTQEWYGAGTGTIGLIGAGAFTGLATTGQATAATAPTRPGPVASGACSPLAAAPGQAGTSATPSDFAVYPTLLAPAEGLRYALSSPLAAQAAGAELHVLTLTGRHLLTQRLAAGATGTAALPALPAGWYLARLRLPDGRWLNTRFAVR